MNITLLCLATAAIAGVIIWLGLTFGWPPWFAAILTGLAVCVIGTTML